MLFAKIRAPGSPILNSNNKVTSITFAMKDFIHSGNEFFCISGAQNMLALDPEGRKLSHSLCFLDFCLFLENPQVMSVAASPHLL